MVSIHLPFTKSQCFAEVNILFVDEILVSRVVLKADRVVHWHESHVEHRYVTVEGHLCLDASHVGNVGVLFTYYLQHVYSVIGGQNVCVVFGISHHRGPHFFVDRRFSVLEIRHRSSFPKADVTSKIQDSIVRFKHYIKNENLSSVIHQMPSMRHDW